MSSAPADAAQVFEPLPRVVQNLNDAQQRLEQLNQAEGFVRWKLECHTDGTFQVIEYRESGGLRWKSFRKTNLRIVVGWATQQTVMHLRARQLKQATPNLIIVG